MARSRTIKPAFHDDKKMAQLSISARYFYQNIWCYMDRDGCIEYDMRLIKSKLCPFDPESMLEELSKAFQELIDKKRLFVVEHNENKILYCPTMGAHQKIWPSETSAFNIPKKVLNEAVSLKKSQLEMNIDAATEQSEKNINFQDGPNSTLLNLTQLNSTQAIGPSVPGGSTGATAKPPLTSIKLRAVGPDEDLTKPHPETNPEVSKMLDEFRKKTAGITATGPAVS